jgi:DNA repair and recombination protein RAD52
MSFTPEQIGHLSAKLDPKHVASRSQSGRSLSYVEGWHVIAEANRIFGFDAWDRELVSMKLLGEPRSVDGKQRVGYMATVRITVRSGDAVTVRDGTGFGSGIDKDLDQAHESALKEAETDAMKRAMMTFGNPFGLALYDKTQSSVGVDQPAREGNVTDIVKSTAKAMDANAPETYITPAGFKRVKGPRLPDADASVVLDALTQGMQFAGTTSDLNTWGTKQAGKVAELPDAHYDKFKLAFMDLSRSMSGRAA